MSHNEFDSYSACIAALCRDDPLLASSLVPAGITRFWGSSLGWPDWFFDGTTFSRSSPLPRHIPLGEDLQMLANLLRHVGEDKLLRLMVEWPRYPGQALVLAAPDLETAIWSRSEAIDLQNAPIRTLLSKGRGHDILEVLLHPMLGPFRPIYEGVILTLYFLMIRSFAGIVKTSVADLSSVTIEQVHSSQELSRLLPCKILNGSSVARIVISRELLAATNPDFDPVAWEVLTNEGKRKSSSRSQRIAMSTDMLEDLLRRSLAEHARVPNLAEVARHFGFSERTLARSLANAGVSYREVLEQVRMSMSKELLLFGDLPVYAVAERLGYSDSTAFVRSFKRQFHVSPAKWRKLDR